MRSRPSQAFSILLLSAAVLPPPRMASTLIAEAPRHDTVEFKKTPQALGRNRIASPARLAPLEMIARLDGGVPRPRRSSRFLARRDGGAVWPAFHLGSPSPVRPATLRLRC